MSARDLLPACSGIPDSVAEREAFEERAGILEFDGGMPHELAEAHALGGSGPAPRPANDAFEQAANPSAKTALVKYDAAVHALAECRSVDEVKDWADKAAAMQAYGRMAKDKTLEIDAAEIRLRAERRLGELLSAQKESAGLAKPGPKPAANSVVSNDRTPTLASAGISKDLSSRAQKLAAVPPAEFESAVAEWRDDVEQAGAKVRATLEKKGERAMSKSQAKRVAVRGPQARIAELEAEVEDLRDAAAEAGERARALDLAEAGDPALEIKKLLEQLRVVRMERDRLMKTNAEQVHEIKVLRGLVERLKKKAGLGGRAARARSAA